MSQNDLIRAIQATAEIFGRTMSPFAAEVFLSDLSAFPPQQLLLALTRCRKELKTFPTIAEIIARINDGRPGVEEAWAMIPKDQDRSVFWTEEMRLAFGVAYPHILDGDNIAARMAFKEAYTTALSVARDTAAPIRWSPSFGDNKSDRERATQEAVDKGRIGMSAAMEYLPEWVPRNQQAQIEGPRVRRALPLLSLTKGELTSAKDILEIINIEKKEEQ